MERKLKPCPFCGGIPHYCVDDVTEENFIIMCGSCKAQSVEYEYLEDAVDAWNKRSGGIVVNNFGNGKQIENKGHITINVGKGTK